MEKLTNRHEVKLVYFGQSIVATDMNWWPERFTQFLEDTYPSASITAVNKAISGHSAERMLTDNTVETLLVPEHPDLIIFYIYYHQMAPV